MITKQYNVSQQNALNASLHWEVRRKAHSAFAALLVAVMAALLGALMGTAI